MGSGGGGPGGGGGACNTGQDGVCGDGVLTCRLRQIVCIAPAPTPEICNGLDDDCDGCVDGPETCEGDLVCLGGECRCRDDSLTDCDNRCVDLDSDPWHCAVCGHECPPGFSCSDGKCTREGCGEGQTDCEGACVDLRTNLLHCGACDDACIHPNAASECVDGECRRKGCQDGFVDLNGNDDDGCECQQSNGGIETCDGEDNDCDGAVDESDDDWGGPLTRDCYQGPPLTRGIGVCRAGYERCVGGDWSGVCSGDVLPAAELCDDLDNDCDGTIDEGELCWCSEADRKPCGSAEGECGAGWQVCTADRHWGACVWEGPADEVGQCDGLDNDCDGSTDEGCGCGNAAPGDVQLCGSDVGVCEPGRQVCLGGVWGSCRGAIGPAPVDCEQDADGRDNDCDGEIDEDDCDHLTEDDPDPILPCVPECADDQECVDGECRDGPEPVVDCDPECEAWETCVDGECQGMRLHGGGGTAGCALSSPGTRAAGPGLLALALLGLLAWRRR